MKIFVLLASQRTGSTFTRLLLNTHPKIRLYSEIFFPNYRPRDGFRYFCESQRFGKLQYSLVKTKNVILPLRKAAERLRENRVKEFLDKLECDPTFPIPWTDISDDSWLGELDAVASYPCEAVGFQLMYSSITKYPAIPQWLADKNVKILHMYRKNVLKKHLSIVTPRASRMSMHFGDGDKKKPVQLDTTTLLNDLHSLKDRIEAHRETYRDSDYMEFTYEDFFADQMTVARTICDFLGVDTGKLTPPEYLKKLAPNKMSDAIENYEEVQALLIGTAFEHMLYE